MFDAPILDLLAPEEATPPRPATSALALATAFVQEHGDGLAAAAELLGGRSAFGRHLRLVGELRRGRLTPRQLERELRHVLALLRLEHVGDPDRDEGAFFVLLHPDSPEVHELCLLTEAVEGLVAEVARLNRRQAAAKTKPALVVRTGPGRRSQVHEVQPRRPSPSAVRARAKAATARLLAKPDAA